MSEGIPEITPEELAARKAAVKETHRCPYCDEVLTEFDVSQNPFNNWDASEVWVCMNLTCGYRVMSRHVMSAQRIEGGSYRFLYVPARDWCGPVADSAAGRLAGPPRG